MKQFEGKTLEDVLSTACSELNVSQDQLHYNVIEEKKGLFSKKVVIECYTYDLVQDYMKDYITRILNDMEFEVEIVTFVQDNRVYCNLNTDNNSILIGKNGVVLRTLNFIVKHAVNTEFKERIEISLDINGYKEARFKKVQAMGRRIGKQVQRSHIDVKLDPMPADERKVMHQVIAEMDHLRTESSGEGKNRFITIYYVD